MATFNRFNCFHEDCLRAKHNLGSDQLAVALTAVAPVATNTVLADLTQVSYTNLSSRNVTTSSLANTSGVAKLTLADLVLTASGNVATFRYVVLYNATSAGNPLIGWVDGGGNVTMSNGETFTIDFNQASGALTVG